MRIAFVASPRADVQPALLELTQAYGQTDPENADCIVAVGGDGTTLRALHATLQGRPLPVFSMRLGTSVGFLGNPYRADGLIPRLEGAVRHSFHPLCVEAEFAPAQKRTFFTLNDASFLRQTRLTAKIRVQVGGRELGDVFVGDGVLVATPVGSTAYNRSVGGPILPLQSGVLALTGIAPYGDAKWSRVVLNDDAVIDLDVLNPAWRPVRLETDMEEARDVVHARITLARHMTSTLLFDPDGSPQQQLGGRFLLR